MPVRSQASIEQNLLHAIVERSNNSFGITDANGVLLHVSPRFVSIYGGELGDYIGHSVYELERAGVIAPSVSALVLRERREQQVMQRTTLGRAVLAQAFPVLGTDGEVERVVSVSFDLTDLESLRGEYLSLQKDLIAANSDEQGSASTEIQGVRFRSTAVRSICGLIRRVAATDANVLMLGETGVGKTLFARELHRLSGRRSGKMVDLNCSAIPEHLFEAELFGYEAGAFTDARRGGKPGLIEEAAGGTFFLDEIGELPLPIQPKLLKVLQDRRVRRVGGTQDRAVDFRLVAATNSDLKAAVDNGDFRPDLYYRLNVIPIRIPPLRERRDDLNELVDHFWNALSRRHRLRKTLDSEVRSRLQGYDWPGNVRELENVLERLMLASDKRLVTAEIANEVIPDAMDKVAVDSAVPQVRTQETLPSALARVEREMLQNAKDRSRSTYEMARVLGISQPTVVRKLRKHGL